MNRRISQVPLASAALAFFTLNACGGGASLDAGGSSNGTIGSFTFAIVGAAQNPVTSSAAYGANVTGIAGALVDRLTLNSQGPGSIIDTKILFQTNRILAGGSEIFSMRADGSAPTNLTNNPAGDYSPAWSPDGSKIAFMSTRDGSFEIYVMNADGSNVTRLTNNTAIDDFPSWSHSGTKLCFYSDRDSGNYEIYTMNSDGSGQTRRTNNPAQDLYPKWSPDGKYIAFVSTRDTSYDIHTMLADGTNVVNVTSNPASDLFPSWSPDSSKIAFTSNRDGSYEIYTVSAFGGNQTRITSNAASETNPSWSPDGKKISFVSDRAGDNDIFSVDADGGPETNLTQNGSSDSLPSWSGLLPATPKTLVGPSAPLGTAAAGFLFGQVGDKVKSVVAFDTATVGSRSASRVASQSAPYNDYGTNLIFSITTSAGLASVSFAPIGDGGYAGTVVSPTIPAGSTAALVSFNSQTGLVSSVLPYAANRSTTQKETKGENVIYTGSFTGVFDAKGTNVAPSGASSITLNAKTGELVSYTRN